MGSLKVNLQKTAKMRRTHSTKGGTDCTQGNGVQMETMRAGTTITRVGNTSRHEVKSSETRGETLLQNRTTKGQTELKSVNVIYDETSEIVVFAAQNVFFLPGFGVDFIGLFIITVNVI